MASTLKLMDKRRIKITLKREMLGMSSNNPNIYREYFEDKARKGMMERSNAVADAGGDGMTLEDIDARIEDEVAAIDRVPVDEKGITVFPRMMDGTPFMWDYQLIGAFKDACSNLRRLSYTRSAKLKAYRKVLDGLIFIGQEKVPIKVPEGLKIDYCERPLRASGPQGDRVALACSEMVPRGSTLEFDVICMDPSHWDYVEEWLTYFSLHGLGQWRNSGKGRCVWEYVDRD